MKRKILIFVLGILLVGSLLFISGCSNEEMTRSLAKCIGENSVLYVSEGCGHCSKQKVLFGEYLDEITLVDCSKNPGECGATEVLMVPTWLINGEKHIGYKSIEELKELTGC